MTTKGRPNHNMQPDGKKRCTGCGMVLPMEDFYQNGASPSGRPKYHAKCKRCLLVQQIEARRRKVAK